jgi:hypothetical protein
VVELSLVFALEGSWFAVTLIDVVLLKASRIGLEFQFECLIFHAEVRSFQYIKALHALSTPFDQFSVLLPCPSNPPAILSPFSFEIFSRAYPYAFQ